MTIESKAEDDEYRPCFERDQISTYYVPYYGGVLVTSAVLSASPSLSIAPFAIYPFSSLAGSPFPLTRALFIHLDCTLFDNQMPRQDAITMPGVMARTDAGCLFFL